MANYLEVKKTDGSVLIDDKSSRLSLQRYGTLWDLSERYSKNTYEYHGGGDPDTDRRCVVAYQFTVPVTSDEILIGFKLLSNDFGLCFNYARNSYNEIKVNIYLTPSSLYLNTDVQSLAKMFIMYIFGEKVGASNRFGLEVFDEKGNRIFNSSEKLLKITGKFDYQYNFIGGNFNSLALSITALDNNRNIIVIPNQFLSGWTKSPNPNWGPCPAVYGITYADGKIIERLIITVGSYNDADWTGGWSGYTSCLFADSIYLP